MVRTPLLRTTTPIFATALIATLFTALGAEHSLAEVTASDLLSLTKSCLSLPSVASFKTDAANRDATIPVCQIPGAIWFKADLDIDCDGGSTAACKADLNYLPDTSCNTSTGMALDAAKLPFIVLPTDSNGLRISDYGIQCGTVAAVIYNNQVEFGIVGDRGPKGVIGEASYAMAERLGINPDPNRGGTSSGVTYIVFTGSNAKVRTNQNHNQAVEIGRKLAAELIAQDLTSNRSTITFQQPKSLQAFALGELVTFTGTANRDVVTVKLQADGRWDLASIPVDQGVWSASYRFSGTGRRQITALGFGSSGKQIAIQNLNIRIDSGRTSNSFSSSVVKVSGAKWKFSDR